MIHVHARVKGKTLPMRCFDEHTCLDDPFHGWTKSNTCWSTTPTSLTLEWGLAIPQKCERTSSSFLDLGLHQGQVDDYPTTPVMPASLPILSVCLLAVLGFHTQQTDLRSMFDGCHVSCNPLHPSSSRDWSAFIEQFSPRLYSIIHKRKGERAFLSHLLPLVVEVEVSCAK
ncbi:hypothetical protein LR69_01412 [Geobacillus sp. BCO2]|nr:hypothetical protein LR69_01412 [Geobacillus sp. BCO2]